LKPFFFFFNDGNSAVSLVIFINAFLLNQTEWCYHKPTCSKWDFTIVHCTKDKIKLIAKCNSYLKLVPK